MTAIAEHRRWWILGGGSLAILMFTIDVSIVNVALPILAKEFKTPLAIVQWVILSYVLVVTSLELGAARLGDLWGRKRLFLIGILLFTVASALCGLASSMAQLIAFRALEGLGGVFMAALGIAIATSGFPEQERGKALGLISAVPPTGIALGPTLGGFLVSTLGWRSIFWVNLPLGLLAFLILSRCLTGDRRPATAESFDYWGCFTFALSLSTFILALTAGQHRGLLHPLPFTLGAIALLSLAFFIRWQLQTPAPMLNLRIFRSLPLSRSILGNLLLATVAGGGLFILPFFYTLVVGLSPYQVGLLLAVPAVANALVSPLSGWAVDRLGDRPIALFGLGLFTVALWGVSQFGAVTPIPLFIATLIPYGMGMGFFYPAMNTVIMTHIPREAVGIGSGLIALTLTLGQLLGTPLMAILVLLPSRHAAVAPTLSQLSAAEFSQGLTTAYTLCMGLIGLGMILLAVRRKSA